jgi:hypothetical protein
LKQVLASGQLDYLMSIAKDAQSFSAMRQESTITLPKTDQFEIKAK